MTNTNQPITEEPHRDSMGPGGIGEDRPPIATLPCEVIQPLSWRGVAWLFSIFIIVFGAMNVAASAYLSHFNPNGGDWITQEKWRMVENVPISTDWVILGDSSCNHGIDTDTWDAALAAQSANLCTIGDMILLDDVWMLQRLIARGVQLKGVVIVHVYDIWDRAQNAKLLGRIPDRSTWASGVPDITLTAEDTLTEFLSRHVPVISQNSSLRSALIRPGRWFERQFSRTAGGYMPILAANPQRVENIADSHLKLVGSREFNISKDNQAALDEIGRIASRNELDVYLVQSPLFDGLLESKEFQTYNGKMSNDLSSWAASGPHLHYVAEIVPFPKSVMESIEHVTEGPARIYTARIAELVMDSRNEDSNPD